MIRRLPPTGGKRVSATERPQGDHSERTAAIAMARQATRATATALVTAACGSDPGAADGPLGDGLVDNGQALTTGTPQELDIEPIEGRLELPDSGAAHRA